MDGSPDPQNNQSPDLPAINDASSNGVDYMHPDKVPPHIAKMISAHKNGQGLVPLFVDPSLAKELTDYFGPSSQVIAHDQAMHGMLGHGMMGQSDDESKENIPDNELMEGAEPNA